jgi:hypothetical protein
MAVDAASAPRAPAAAPMVCGRRSSTRAVSLAARPSRSLSAVVGAFASASPVVGVESRFAAAEPVVRFDPAGVEPTDVDGPADEPFDPLVDGFDDELDAEGAGGGGGGGGAALETLVVFMDVATRWESPIG